MPSLSFQSPPWERFHRYGRAVTVLDDGPPLWWALDERRWISDEDRRTRRVDAGSHASGIRTLRAFKRHLRRHRVALSGRRVLWINQYEGHDVWADMPALGAK